MFENFFHEFMPRAYTMEGERSLQLIYALANLLCLVYSIVMGALLLYYRFFKKGKGMTLFIPMGVWFLLLFVYFSLNILAIWHKYLWIATVVLLLAGLAAFWGFVYIPTAINERKKLRDCEDLRDDYDELKKKVDEQAAVIKELKIK